MAKIKKLIVTLDDNITEGQIDRLVEFLANLFDESSLSYAIERPEDEDCPDEPTP